MSFKIKVAWRIENGEAKGRVIEDEKGRRKIVFLARTFGGRKPRDGEITDAIIEKDTKPEELGKGALLVSPRYAPNPNDLSKEDAHAKLVELARAALPVFNERYIEVDLPGWQGDLMIKIPKWLNEGSLSATWSFHAKNGQILFGTLEMTTGVRFVRRRGLVVTDLSQAIKDLGEPDKADGTRGGVHVTWTDRHGYHLSAEASYDDVASRGCIFRNFRVEDCRVAADVVLLNGKWVHENQGLTHRECLYSSTGELSRADFTREYVSILNDEQRRTVALLARSALHSPAWYQQHVIAEALNPQATGSEAIWQILKQLKALAEDIYTPFQRFEWPVPRIDRLLAEVNELRALKPSYRGQGNPEIYTSEPDDSAEVARMAAENVTMFAKLKAEYDEVKASIDVIRELRRDPSFPYSIDSEFAKLQSEAEKALVGLNEETSAGSNYLRPYVDGLKVELQRNQQYLANYRRFRYTRQDCEQWLEVISGNLHYMRQRWQEALKRQQELDATQAVESQPVEPSAGATFALSHHGAGQRTSPASPNP
ncbi:MAG: hypothetical protein ACYC44_03265 [Patescibacteria group bacterium]